MKLIAIDLDGTLLSQHLSISEENLTAIHAAQEQQNIVMICSGRAKEDIVQLLKRYNLSCPIGASNGAVTYAEGKVLKETHIEAKSVFQVLEQLEKAQFPYKLYTNQGIYVPSTWKERVITDFQANTETNTEFSLEELDRITEKQAKDNIITFFTDYNVLLAADDLHIEKFFILALDGTRRKNIMQTLQTIPSIAVTTSGSNNLEVMNKHAHKGNGLKVIAAHFAIPLQDTIAIGDNFNDVPMLQAAGFSIAMGNAEDEVKKLCDAVTLTNEEHGVAYALHKYILGKDTASV
ncbi:Cof-type HAD-IIB family hydrolase [Bacillus sp. 165]|uniref:Cof-type HAD-IIB family hydrolase n=1 Tax=Bacillus sp. 165 TaxID=1529117 RepID=UPI0032AF6C6D